MFSECFLQSVFRLALCLVVIGLLIGFSYEDCQPHNCWRECINEVVQGSDFTTDPDVCGVICTNCVVECAWEGWGVFVLNDSLFLKNSVISPPCVVTTQLPTLLPTLFPTLTPTVSTTTENQYFWFIILVVPVVVLIAAVGYLYRRLRRLQYLLPTTWNQSLDSLPSGTTLSTNVSSTERNSPFGRLSFSLSINSQPSSQQPSPLPSPRPFQRSSTPQPLPWTSLSDSMSSFSSQPSLLSSPSRHDTSFLMSRSSPLLQQSTRLPPYLLLPTSLSSPQPSPQPSLSDSMSSLPSLPTSLSPHVTSFLLSRSSPLLQQSTNLPTPIPQQPLLFTPPPNAVPPRRPRQGADTQLGPIITPVGVTRHGTAFR